MSLGTSTASKKHCGSYTIISLAPKMLLKKKQTFEKHRLFFHWKKNKLANFFSYYRVSETPENPFWGFTRRFTFFVQVMYCSIGPNRSLQRNVSKKGYLPGDKWFWFVFSLIFSVTDFTEQFVTVRKVLWLIWLKK